MNLGEAKKLVLKLLDEAKPKSDLTGKLIPYFDAAQQAASAVRPVVKTMEITVEGGIYQPGREVRSVRGVRELSGGRVSFAREGALLRFARDGSYLMEYDAYPAKIPDDAADTTEFEVDAACHLALCYYVAAQTQSMEYDRRFYEAFFSQWQGELANLAEEHARPVASVQGGILCTIL